MNLGKILLEGNWEIVKGISLISINIDPILLRVYPEKTIRNMPKYKSFIYMFTARSHF